MPAGSISIAPAEHKTCGSASTPSRMSSFHARALPPSMRSLFAVSSNEDGSVINGADGHGGGRIGAWERNDEGTKGRGGERWLLLAFVPPRVKS